MDRVRIANSLIALAKQIMSYNVTDNPIKVKKKLEDFGIKIESDGKVIFYRSTPLGNGFTNDVARKFDDVDSALRQSNHIKDSLNEELEKDKIRMNALTRFKVLVEKSEFPDEDAQKKLITHWKGSLGRFHNKRLREVNKKAISKEVYGMLEDVQEGYYLNIKKRFKVIEGLSGTLNEKINGQLKVNKQRRVALMTISKYAEKNEDYFQILFR